MALSQWFGTALVSFGVLFFIAGTCGLLRFPDVYNRLHALTKADNLGLGLVVWGLAVQAPSLAAALKMLLIWMLVLISGATSCYLIAHTAMRQGVEPWQP